ncbi:hypothetical protein CDD83_2477 [Cordyceps sp. RAO-2017]|nr:hypothetical protein CDD83_2477 [Cordyceps sp. RAO-2017]
MSGWDKTPPEIREQILELAAEGHSFATDGLARAGHAIVCKDWWRVFEPHNFREIRLDRTRIAAFRQLFTGANERRQAWLRQITLAVILPEYQCDDCEADEGSSLRRAHDRLLTETLWDLLIILSSWNRPRLGPKPKLVLDLGAYSPSDSQHSFRDFRLQDGYPYRTEADLD